MTTPGVYIQHRYGRYGGTIKVQGRGGNTSHRSTESAMLDKCRYAQTRFAGETNTLYDADGGDLGDYRAAYQHTAQAAEQLATTNTGRSKGVSYIYDTTINPGSGKFSNQAAHQLASRFVEELTSKGYQVGGVQYAIHQGTDHTHIHMMYATSKTLQLRDLRPMSGRLRDLAQTLEQRRDQVRELNRELEQAHTQEQVPTLSRSQR